MTQEQIKKEIARLQNQLDWELKLQANTLGYCDDFYIRLLRGRIHQLEQELN